MRVQLHCIARIRVVYVYLKEGDLLPSLIVQSSSRRAPLLLGPQRQKKCRAGANSSSRKKGLAEPGSLTNTNLIENTNIIEKNCLFCILSPVLLLPRALRNRSDHIDIPSTQHRSSKGSRRPTKARKPESFRKWIPIRRVHNRMDKLTLTRQFVMIQFGIFLGRYREGIGM